MQRWLRECPPTPQFEPNVWALFREGTVYGCCSIQVLGINIIMYYLHITGVYLSLRGVKYTNNSVIPITEIEHTLTSNGMTDTTSNNGLQCITNRRPCCQTKTNRHGEWIFPNGTMVPIQDGATSFFRNRGDDGTVNLNRLNSDVMMPTGRFCCVVPDATSVNQTVCANISKLTTTEISIAIINT